MRKIDEKLGVKIPLHFLIQKTISLGELEELVAHKQLTGGSYTDDFSVPNSELTDIIDYPPDFLRDLEIEKLLNTLSSTVRT